MNTSTSQQTLPQKAADAIIRLIQTENYTAGTKLPNEYELSHMLKVSRNTVREAIKLLVSRNILEVRRGAGTFVSDKHGLGDDPLGLSMITDPLRMMNEMIQICVLIEPKSAALAAQYATKDDIQKLCTLLSKLEMIQQNDTIAAHNDAEFHLHIAYCCNNTIIYNISKALYDCISRRIDCAIGTCNSMLSDHRRIYQAIESRDSCLAHDAMLIHLLHQQEYLQQLTPNLSADKFSKKHTPAN